MERYNRQIILPELGEKGQQRLQQAKVLIVGVGGLGSPVALYLTGAGVGTIGLIDDDVVSVSNLQRQVLYSEAEVGMPKAIQAKKRLEALNHDVQINAYPTRLTKENADEIIRTYDIIIDGCDNFATRYLINDICVKWGKVYVYGAIRAFEGQVSVFNYQGGPDYRHFFAAETVRKCASGKKRAVTAGIIGCAEAAEVLKIIGEYGEVLSGKLWTINVKTMETHLISF